MNLEIKYRPKTLDEYWGNDLVKNTINQLSKNNSIPNNILISGNPGIGKSSLAYIITKYILCSNKEDNLPCEQCSNCISVNTMYETGRTTSRNIVRLALGNSNHQDYLDSIISSISVKKENPRVFFIDELQMISLIEQEKLNDPMEYINKNSYVIMTTSNINHIAKSIITRCKHFVIHNPSIEEQMKHLKNICNNEGLHLSEKKLKDLIINSGYNPRTVMKNLTDVKTCGEHKFYSIIQDNDILIKECMEYFKSLQYGTFRLIEFLETHEDISRVFYGLPEFLYQLIKFKYNKTSVHPEYKSTFTELSYTYQERALLNVLKSLETTSNYLSKDKIKMKLVAIAYELNEALYELSKEPDELTSLIHSEEKKQEVKEKEEQETKAKMISASFGNTTGTTIFDL